MSVGERQLVALARAQIASPGLLILDEATSAVDPGTERRINEALRRLGEGRTVVTIAHRLSTAEGADRVFVFDAGRLIEEGTHDRAGDGGRPLRQAVRELARQHAGGRHRRPGRGTSRLSHYACPP